MATATALKTGDKVYSKSKYFAPQLIGTIIGHDRKGYTTIRQADSTIIERENRHLMTEVQFNEFTAEAEAEAADKATQDKKRAAADKAMGNLALALGGRVDNRFASWSDVHARYITNHRSNGRYDYKTVEIKADLLVALVEAAKAGSDKFDDIDLAAILAAH